MTDAEWDDMEARLRGLRHHADCGILRALRGRRRLRALADAIADLRRRLAEAERELSRRKEELRLAQCPNPRTDVGHCDSCAGLSVARTRRLHELEEELADLRRRALTPEQWAAVEAWRVGGARCDWWPDVLPLLRALVAEPARDVSDHREPERR